MLGKQSSQRSLYDVGNVFSYTPDPKSFYGQLAPVSSRLFSDDEFATFYSSRQGRPSVPPSHLALIVVMQFYAGISDAEAIERTGCDLRWCAVLGRGAGSPLCAKSTLQMFRSHLILHDGIRLLFERSLSEARRSGLLPKEMRAALDTKPILGRGAVEDTYNLLACGIRQLASALTRHEGLEVTNFYEQTGLSRYLSSSIKGTEILDWSDPSQREEFLSGIVADAIKLLQMSVGYESGPVRDAAVLLEQLLLQDVDIVRDPNGDKVTIHRGVKHGRIPSATDPEQRHGRKSASKRFTGSKASVVTETSSGIILATDVIDGDAPDATGALKLIEEAEQNVQVAEPNNEVVKVVETFGDCAYGNGKTRQDFDDAGRMLSVRVPLPSVHNGHYTKNAFEIDVDAQTVTCPNNITNTRFYKEPDGTLIFTFGKVCKQCPLREYCTSSGNGRTVQVHPQEKLLQTAFHKQKDPEWRLHIKKRLAVENSLARLSQYGIGQARYIGQKNTKFQLKMSATVANFRRTWNWEARQKKNQLLATVG